MPHFSSPPSSSPVSEAPPEDPGSPTLPSAWKGGLSCNLKSHSLPRRFLCWLRHALLRRNGESLKEAIEEVIEEHTEETGALSSEEKVMLHNVLNFGELRVEDIMVPRASIVAVEYAARLEDLVRVVSREEHTRMPVYRDSLDDTLGFLHVKDLIPYLAHGAPPFDMDKILRKALVVPPSMRVADLLVRMRLSGNHLALVVDEYGGTDGLVTLEDIFEEIVGDIQDEHDEPEYAKPMQWTSGRTVEVDAALKLTALEEAIGVAFSPEDKDRADTLGGLVFILLGRVPEVGESVPHPSGLTFTILDADARRIRKLRLLLPQAETQIP